ncbi:MAG: SCP2 sterol-binding domain-containing protein [Candidatus Thorarchaeota archaeon]
MLDSKSFNSVLVDLGNQDEEFKVALDQIIKFIVLKFNNTEELQEEIADYDSIYQIIIKDINFNFWLKISHGSIIYKKGINKDAAFKVKYTKDILIKILKRELYGTDAYMKALIQVDGNLSDGLRYIKLFRLFMKYLNNGFKKLK